MVVSAEGTARQVIDDIFHAFYQEYLQMIRDCSRLNLQVTDFCIVCSNDKVKSASHFMSSFIFVLTQTKLRKHVLQGDGIRVTLMAGFPPGAATVGITERLTQ